MFKEIRSVVRYFAVFVLLIFFQLLFPGSLSASIHYVSPTGNATWAQSTKITTPCSTSVAMKNAAGGDTVYFRGGIYAAGQSSGVTPVFYPANSGSKGNPIIFKAYPGETPIINGTITPKVTGIAGAGTTNTTLVDPTKNFNALGIVHWDVLRTANTVKGGAAVSSVVDSHTISLYRPGSHNTLTSFQEGDYYEIGKDATIVFGTGNDAAQRNYIIFDGFTIQANSGEELALVRLDGSSPRSTGNIVRNMTFIGPLTKKIVHGDNREFLRIEDNSNTLVQRCSFNNLHHVKEGVKNWVTHNTSGIKSYRSDNVIIENCEVSNTACGIYLKSDTDDSVIRYNYIHDNREGILINPDTVKMNTDRVQIYHNVVVNCSDMTSNIASLFIMGHGDAGTHGNDISVYNNTFHNSNKSVFGFGINDSGHGSVAYNNIIITSKNYSMTTGDRVGGAYQNHLKEADHNFWGTPWRTIRIGDNYRNQNYTSLANWQAAKELESAVEVGCGSNQNPGCGDLTGDPLFVNASGKMNELADFALSPNSPCKGAGRGGVDMGANIDLVGILPK